MKKKPVTFILSIHWWNNPWFFRSSVLSFFRYNRRMAQPASPNWLIRIQQVLTVIFLLYVLVLLGRSAWKNIESNRRMDALRDEIATLRLENAYLENLIIYQQTDSYKELEARRKLGLQKPGELVVDLPDEPTLVARSTDGNATTTAGTQHPLELWWDYFFE